MNGAFVASGASEADFIGSTATLTVSFSNDDASQPGYAPFIDLVLPAGTSALSFQGATYLGQPVTAQTVAFDAQGHAESPVAKDANGNPVVIDGPAGGTLVTLSLPFGSFTPGQTPADIAVQLGVSSNALVGAPLDVTATGGFAFGNSPTGVSASNPPILGATASLDVVPQIVTLQTVYQGPEQETATGPSYPRAWDSVATIAPGQTLTNLVLTQTLPDGAVFLPGSSRLIDGGGTAAGTVTYDPATRTVTGTFTAPETGSASNTPTLQTGFYVTQDYSNQTPVLDPTTGAFAPLTDTSDLTANWHSTNPGNPSAVNAGPASDTITAKSIAIQKGVTDLSHGPAAYQPGDTLQYSLDGQVSNYFDVNDLVITDTLGDGQTFKAGVTPSITIADQGTTLYSGTVAAGEYSVSGKAADGSSTVTFDVSKILTDNGQADDLNGGTAAHPAPATAGVTFDTTIDPTYVSTPAPSVSTLVDQGDTIGDTVVFSGRVVGSGDPIQDSSSAAVTLPTNTVAKSVYAVNGVVVSGPVTIQAGDLVTYDLKLATPLTSTQDVSLTDYLPLPTFVSGSGLTFDDTQSALPPAVGTADFGPANTFDPVSGTPVTVTANATANSLTFDLGDYTDEPAGTYPAETADILYTVQAGDQPFADGLLLTNQVHATETNSFGATTTSNAIVQVKLGEPELKIEKAVESTTEPNAVFTGDTGPGGIIDDTTLAADPLHDSVSGIVAGDSVGFKLVVQNTGTGPNGAFDVVLHDTIPTGFDTPFNVQVTDGAGNPLAYTVIGGGLFDPNGGIQLTDPGAQQGALAADNASSGANIAVITYDAVAATTVPVPDYDLHNTATITNYAAEQGGTNHTVVTPAANLTASTDVYTATPSLAKAVVSTSAVAPDADGTSNIRDLAIGEQATYDVTLTLTKGTAGNVTLSDLLPDGSGGELDLVSAQVKSIGSDISGSALAVGDTSATGSFAFGTLTDGSNAQGAADQIVVEVTALAVNDANNRGGESVTNTAKLSETNPNPGGGTYTQTATATESLVEPSLHLAKTSNTHTVQAGDTVTYTLKYTNTGTAAAYGTEITDPLNKLGADAAFNAGSVTITRDTATGTSIVTGNGTGDSSVAVDVGEIDPGQEVDVTYTARVLTTAVDGSSFINTAGLTASTLVGSNPDARTETASGSDTVGVQKAGIAKTLIAGSDPAIAVPHLAQGETGTYQLVVTLPHGASPDFSVVDTLPAGEIYVAGSEKVVATGAAVTTGTPSFGTSGNTLTASFGDVQDSGTGADTAADQVVIQYQATVADIAANANGTVLTNTASTEGGGKVLNTATANTDVVAPHLTLAKTDNVTSGQAGTDVTYTLTIGQTGTSPAYDVSLTDLLPADETYDAGSVTASAGSASFAAGTITFDDAAIAANSGPITITYRATLDDSVTPAEQLTNTASLGYATQPTGGYQEPAVTAHATVPVNLTPAEVKTVAALSNGFSGSDVVTGETVTYQLVTTLQPGTQEFRLTDVLPAGLTLASETVASIGASVSGAGLQTGAIAPTAGVYDFGTVQVVPGGTAASDQVVVDVTATVGQVAGGTTFTNSAIAAVSQPGSTTAGLETGTGTAPTLTDVKSSLSGTIFTDNNDDGVLNGADSGLGGVTIDLIGTVDGNTVTASTVTAANGSYSFQDLEVGTYHVQVVSPTGYADDTVQGSGSPAVDSITDPSGATAPVTLSPGANTPDQNGGLFEPVSLSGTVFNDRNADGAQQPGDTGYAGDIVQLLDGNGQPIAGATTTTDAHGNYSFTGLLPGSYAVQVMLPAGDSFSPAGTSATLPDSIVGATGRTAPVTLTSGQSAANQDAGVYGPGSLSGTVFTDNNDDGVIDGADVGLAGVTVRLLDGSGTPTGATTTTGADGSYSFTGLHPANYAVQVVAPGDDRFSPVGTGPAAVDSIVNAGGTTAAVAVSSNADTPNQNAGVYVPVSIGGVVFTDQNADGVQQAGDNGIAGDTVTLLRGTTVIGTATTGADGSYDFAGLAPGSYSVSVATPAGDTFSPPATGNPPVDSVVNGAGSTPVVTLTSGQSAPYENAGAYAPASLSGHAFFDSNADGQQEAGEATIAGVTVTLLDAAGHSTGRTATTDASGGYRFTGLTPGQYSVQFTTPAGDRISPVGGGPAAVDSIVDGTGATPQVTLTSGEALGNQNAGYYMAGSLSGTVFTDNNDDGVLDQADAGLGGVTVALLDSHGTPTGDTAVTDAGGHYAFGTVIPGQYSVQVVAPGSDGFSPVGTDANPALDSIVGPAGRTPLAAVVANQDTPNQNAGLYAPVSLSGTVFTDQNADGSQEAGDQGFAGDTVQLLDGAGHPIAGETATTDANGDYGFSGLKPGTYAVQVTDPAGELFSPRGTSTTVPNSIVGPTGSTAPVTLSSGQSLPGQDAGVYALGGISGNVFLDQNADGAKQPGDTNQAGDTVHLLAPDGTVIGTTTTDASGNYSFQGLAPGQYAVQVVPPAGDRFSPPGTSTTLEDSVVDGAGKTGPVTITSGLQVTGENAGDYAPATIQGTAFLDAHCDGTDDYGDPAFKGVTVRLLDGNGQFTGLSTTTDANGRYSFGSLTPGQYQVQFVAPTGTGFAAERAGSNDAVDSDANAQGFSEVFTLTSGETDPTHGVGLTLTGGTANSPTTYLNATTTVATGNGAGITVIGGQGPQADNIAGGQGNNILVGGMGSNVIESGYGNDFVLAGCGPFAQVQSLGQNDFIFGGPGNDVIQGHGGNLFAVAGVGNQTIYGAGGHNTFIANANSGTISDAGGTFSNVMVGDHFTTGGNTNVVYNAGDGVVLIDDYNPAAGDTLTVNGYAAPTAVGNADGYNVLYFGPNAAVLLWAGQGALTPSSPVPAGVTFNAAAPSTAPVTVSIDANGFFTLTQAGAANPIIGPSPGAQITGAASGQTTTGEGAVTPFFGVRIADPAPGQAETVTVTPFSQGDGVFAALGGGTVTNGAYSITGAPAAVTAALDRLQFVPTLSGIGVGQSLTAQFNISVTDTAGFTTTNSATSLTETRADMPPAITGTVAGQSVADTGSVAPFFGVHVTDPDGGLAETATVTLSSTANGMLGNTNAGSYDKAAGVFTVSGSAQSVSAVLEQLSFTPVAHAGGAGSTVTTGFTVKVTDALGGSATDATTSVVAAQSAATAVPVAQAAGGASVSLAQGQSFTGGNADYSVFGNQNGGNTISLGSGSSTVQLAGYGSSVTLGSGSVTGGSGNDAVTLTGTGTVSLAGYGNSVTASGTDTVDGGYGATIHATGGSQSITLEGYGSLVFIGGGATASVQGGSGNSQIVTASGTVAIGLAGYGNTVTTGAAADTITDSAYGYSRFDVGGGSAPGLEILQNFAANAGSVVAVAGAAAAGYDAGSLYASLTTNAAGYAQLALPDNGGAVVFAGLAPNQLHASNFQAG